MSKIEELKAKQMAAKKREDRAYRTAHKAKEEYFAIGREIHKEELRLGVGNEVHVTHGLEPIGHWLNETVGTLLKVKQVYCLIDFGEHGKWNIPIRHVKFITQDPGRMLGYVNSKCVTV